MSLESSQERSEQEQPRSTTSAETDHGPAVHVNSGGEQIPANITTALALDTGELVDLLLPWIRTSNWSTSQTYLQTHSELLTEAAVQVLMILTHHQPDQQAYKLLILHQHILQIAGQQRVEVAYEALLHQEEEYENAVAELKELQAQVVAWLQTSDWETSQTYLQSHPQLLTDAAEQMMEVLKRSQREQEAQAIFNLHHALLQKARGEGIKAAYEALLHQEEEYENAVAELKELQAQVVAWLQTSDWETSQTYLQSHPQLLTDAAEQMMEVLKRSQREQEAQKVVNLYQTLLQIAREEGIEAAYESFLDSEPETPLNEQDVAAYQALQDPAILNNAGVEAIRQYWASGQQADLNRAVECWQEALSLTPSNSPDRSLLLSNLGSGLRERYGRTGALDDLERAITVSQQAVQATPPDSANLADRLSNLGAGLRSRSAHTGDLANLKAAITTYQQAVQASSPDSPNWSLLLTNLGSGLYDRYARTGDLADLEAAITTCQQAVQASSPDSPNWSLLLSNLGAVLHERYARSRDLADLEAAITTYQQAVQVSSPDSYLRPFLLNNLGSGLYDRYARSRDLADLEAAITTYQQAVQASPPDAPNRYGYLSNLGDGLRDRYRRTGELADLEAAISAWERSWAIPHLLFATFPVTYKLGQQRQGAGVAASLVQAYLEQAKQHHPRSPSVSRRALEIAEGSKSRLLTELVGRGPLPLPSGLSQEIAAREQLLLAEMNALDTQELTIHDHFAPTQEETGHLQRLQQRQATLRELEDLWTRIAHVGPEGTAYVALRRGDTPTWQELARLTKALEPATALLSFFTTTDRALLFLLRTGWRTPHVVEVPLNQTGWADLLMRFFREIHRYGLGLHRSETWDQPLRPLFTKAQHHLEGVERLILAPKGNGHLLPWGVVAERAGWHTSAGQLLPLVTLPALSILPRLRQRPHVHTGPALVIGNPRGDLPSAEGEANTVAERFGTKPLLGAAATKSAVLNRFPEATLIHLATHAFFDADNPLESGIVLADGVLTAREVLQHRLQADLLVLSACESGRVVSLGGEELAGLSQAFLQAGVRSLLVSLWRVNDPATAALMQAFYIARQAGADKALALRQAMTQIQQDSRWAHPYYWGAFVLMGDWE